MKKLIYAMQFAGNAAPVEGSAGVMKASTTARSCNISTAVGAEGVAGTIAAGSGGEASFESEVTITGEKSFLEKGSIRFGDRHVLRFTTEGQGYLGDSADPALKHGAVIWKIQGGEGQFAGATGLITSNFTLSDRGEVTDNQFGLIFLK